MERPEAGLGGQDAVPRAQEGWTSDSPREGLGSALRAARSPGDCDHLRMRPWGARRGGASPPPPSSWVEVAEPLRGVAAAPWAGPGAGSGRLEKGSGQVGWGAWGSPGRSVGTTIPEESGSRGWAGFPGAEGPEWPQDRVPGSWPGREGGNWWRSRGCGAEATCQDAVGGARRGASGAPGTCGQGGRQVGRRLCPHGNEAGGAPSLSHPPAPQRPRWGLS